MVACFECGIEYSSGRGNLKETALCAIKGFMAVSLFTVVPIRLYELSVTLQASLTAGITGYGTSIGEAAPEIVDSLSGIDSLTGMTTGSYFGFASITKMCIRDSFFAKLGTAYFEYRKSGQFEWAAPAILFACLVFTLTAPMYLWSIIGI